MKSLELIYKFGHLVGGEERIFAYPDVWAKQQTSGPDRLVVGPSQGHVLLLRELVSILQGPFWLLYVLEVPRGGGEAGRYQSPEPLSADRVDTFLHRFCEFLEQDGRHQLWIRSAISEAMLVYDRHNLVYLYGPMQDFKPVLDRHLIARVDKVEVPMPHAHRYWAEHDQNERELLTSLRWSFLPEVES